MDWSKAKNIFIFVLVLLNLFLLGNIIYYMVGQQISSEIVKETKSILGSRGITLECSIPSYDDDTPKLSYQNGFPDGKKIIAKLLGTGINLPENLENSTLRSGTRQLVFYSANFFEYINDQPQEVLDIFETGNVEKYLHSFINDLGLKASNFKVDEHPRNSDGTFEFLFIEQYKGHPVFDNQIRFTVGEKGIYKIHYNCRKIKGFSIGPKTRVIPAYKVLLRNFSQDGSSIITRMEIGFKGSQIDPDVVESSVGPVWRLSFKGSPDRYFQASTGEEIK